MAAYLRDLVAVFDAIKLPMMIAEPTLRLHLSTLPERSIDSTGSSPLSFLISRGWPSMLQEKEGMRGISDVKGP